MPDFARCEELSGRACRISYSGNLDNRRQEVLSDPAKLIDLPGYGIAGAKFVELKLRLPRYDID
jgi:hypothetical protein